MTIYIIGFFITLVLCAVGYGFMDDVDDDEIVAIGGCTVFACTFWPIALPLAAALLLFWGIAALVRKFRK